MLIALASLTQFSWIGRLLILDHMFAVDKNSSGVEVIWYGKLVWMAKKGHSIQGGASGWIRSRLRAVSVHHFCTILQVYTCVKGPLSTVLGMRKFHESLL
jgi:hypothetical protein